MSRPEGNFARQPLQYGNIIALRADQECGYVATIVATTPMLAVVPETKSPDLNILNSLFQVCGVEDTDRQSELGNPVVYGQVVRLLFIETAQFLCCKRKVQALRESSNLRVTLEAGRVGSKGCLWRVMPRFKSRVEGEHVCLADEVVLMLADTNDTLHVASQIEQGTYEINASTSYSGFTVHGFDTDDHTRPSVLRAANCLLLHHIEASSYLASRCAGKDYLVILEHNEHCTDQAKWLARGMGEHPPPYSSNAMFVVELEDPLLGGILKPLEPFRLKSRASGRYLTVRRGPHTLVRSASIDSDTAHAFDNAGTNSTEFHVTTSTCRSEEGTLFTFHPVSDADTTALTVASRVLVHCPALGAWLGIKEKTPSTSAQLERANQTFSASVAVSATEKPMLQNAFELQRVEGRDSVGLIVVLSQLPDLQKYIDTWEDGDFPEQNEVEITIRAVEHLITFCVPDTLKNIRECSGSHAGNPVRAHQKLLLDQNVHLACLQAIQAPFNRGFTVDNLSLPDFSEILIIFRLCYHLIKIIVMGVNTFGQVFAEYIPQMQEHISFNLGAEEALIAIFHNNPTLVRSLVNKPFVRFLKKTISMKGRDEKYIKLLSTVCVANEKGLPRQQDLVLEIILEDSHVLKMQVISGIVKIVLPEEEITQGMRPLIPFEIFCSDESPIYKYHQASVNMCAALCADRNSKAHTQVPKFFPLDVIIACILNTKLPPATRAAFVNLYIALHVDCDPNNDVSIEQRVKIWSKITEDPPPPPALRPEVTEFKEWLLDHFNANAAQKPSAQGKNELTYQCLRLCRSFVRFGFFRTDELPDLVPLLLEILDGSSDGDDSVGPIANVRQSSVFPDEDHPTPAAWDRYASTEQNLAILRCKTEICSLLSVILDVFNSAFVGKLIFYFKNKEAAPIISQVQSLYGQSRFSQREAHTDSYGNAIRESSNLDCREHDLARSETAIMRRCVHVLRDCLCYRHTPLVLASLDLLYRLFNRTADLLPLLRGIQLLHSDASQQAYTDAQSVLARLKLLLAGQTTPELQQECLRLVNSIVRLCGNKAGGADWVRNLGLHVLVIERILADAPASVSQARELVKTCFSFVKAFCVNRANQAAIFPYVETFHEYVGCDFGAEEALLSVLHNNLELCREVATRTVILICKNIRTGSNIKLLQELMLCDHVALPNNQSLVTNCLLTSTEALDLLTGTRDVPHVHYLSQSGPAELEYHLDVIDLLARCAKAQSAKIRMQCRRLVPLEEVLEVLCSPALPFETKGPYTRFFQDVFVDDPQLRQPLQRNPQMWAWIECLTDELSELHSLMALGTNSLLSRRKGKIFDPGVVTVYLYHSILPCLHLAIGKVLVFRLHDGQIRPLHPFVDALSDLIEFYLDLEGLTLNLSRDRSPEVIKPQSPLKPAVPISFTPSDQITNPFYVPKQQQARLHDVLRLLVKYGCSGQKWPKTKLERLLDLCKIKLPDPEELMSEGAKVFFSWLKFIKSIEQSRANREDYLFKTLALLLLKREASLDETIGLLVHHLKSTPLSDRLRICTLQLLRRIVLVQDDHKDEAYIVDPLPPTPNSLLRKDLAHRQCIVDADGLSSVIIDVTGSANDSLARAALLCMTALLEGGNSEIQRNLRTWFHSVSNETFFLGMRIQLQKYKSLLLDKRRMLKTLLQKAGKSFNSEEPYPNDLMVQIAGKFDFSQAVIVLRFLQLLTEGHYLELQNYLRAQEDNIMSIDVVAEVVGLLRVTLKSLDRTTVLLTAQLMDTLTEFVQGPCLGNQLALVNTNTCSSVNSILRDNFSDVNPNILRDLKEKAMTLLQSLIEGPWSPHKVGVVCQMVAALDLHAMANAMDSSYQEWEDGLLLRGGSAIVLTNIKKFGLVGQDDANGEKLNLGCHIFTLFKEFLSSPSTAVKTQVREVLAAHPSFRYFNKITSSIEVVSKGEVHFRVPAISVMHLSEDSQMGLIREVDRRSQPAKLTGFFDKAQDLIHEIEYYEELSRTPLLHFFNKQHANMVNFSLVIAFAINILLIAAADTDNLVSAKTGLEGGARRAFIGLSLTQLVFQSLLTAHFIVGPLQVFIRAKWRTWVSALDDAAINKAKEELNVFEPEIEKNIESTIGPARHLAMSFWFAAHNHILFRRLGMMACAFLGYFSHPAVNVVLMFEVASKSAQLRNVVSSVTRNGRALLLVTFLFCVLSGLFTAVCFYGLNSVFEDESQANVAVHCRSMVHCFILNAAYGIRFDGGLADMLNAAPWDYSKKIIWGRLIFEMIYFVLVEIFFLNIVLGIVIDTFAELRAEKQAIETDHTTRCFICGIEASVFDRNASGGGFNHHILHEHNMWMYLFFMHYLKRKPKNDLNGQEGYVWELMSKRDISFFPVGTARSLEEKNILTEEVDVVSRLSAEVEKLVPQINQISATVAELSTRACTFSCP